MKGTGNMLMKFPVHFLNRLISGNSIFFSSMIPDYWNRRTAEAILIQKRSPTMNLDCGLQLPTVWKPILDKLQPPFLHDRFLFLFFTNLFTNFPPLSLSVMMSSVSAKYLLDHFHSHLQSPRLTKTFEVETSRVFTLTFAYFARNN